MTSLPFVLDDDEPIGIILRAGRKMLRRQRSGRTAGSQTRPKARATIRTAICPNT